MTEWVAMGVCFVVFWFGVFRLLVEREIKWQEEHAEDLERERATFRQPKIKILKDPGVLRGAPQYELEEDFEFEWMGHRRTVQKKTRIDGASVPRLFWIFGYLPFGLDLAGSVGHDDLCENRPWWSNWIDAARFFRHYNRLGEVRPAAIVAKFWAVVLFGPKWLRKSEPSRS
jgi:hypothetical protein